MQVLFFQVLEQMSITFWTLTLQFWAGLGLWLRKYFKRNCPLLKENAHSAKKAVNRLKNWVESCQIIKSWTFSGLQAHT